MPAILARVVLALGPTVRRWVRYEVDVQTLDYFCQQANRLPTVLKIDVEGWEYPALCGVEQTLGGGSVRLVVFESEYGATGQILDPRTVAYTDLTLTTKPHAKSGRIDG